MRQPGKSLTSRMRDELSVILPSSAPVFFQVHVQLLKSGAEIMIRYRSVLTLFVTVPFSFLFFFLDSVWILIVAPLLLFLTVIVVFAYWHIKKNPFKRKSVMLPKSLVT